MESDGHIDENVTEKEILIEIFKQVRAVKQILVFWLCVSIFAAVGAVIANQTA